MHAPPAPVPPQDGGGLAPLTPTLTLTRILTPTPNLTLTLTLTRWPPFASMWAGCL